MVVSWTSLGALLGHVNTMVISIFILLVTLMYYDAIFIHLHDHGHVLHSSNNYDLEAEGRAT